MGGILCFKYTVIFNNEYLTEIYLKETPLLNSLIKLKSGDEYYNFIITGIYYRNLFVEPLDDTEIVNI